MQKNLKIALSLFILASCSSLTSLNVEGVKKVQYSSVDDPRAQLFYKEYRPKKKRYRSISSLDNSSLNNSSVTNSSGANEKNTSSKASYFLSLYGQYQKLNLLTGRKSELKSCPQFHNEIVTSNQNLSVVKNVNSIVYKSVRENEQAVALYSFMGLKYKKDEDVYSYLTRTKKWDKAAEVVKKALTKHNKYNENELMSLCSEGSSDGYYAFLNMVSFHSSESFTHSEKYLDSLLKIPAVSNMLILTVFSQSGNTAEKQLLKKLNASWFKTYLDEIKKEIHYNKKHYSLMR